MTNWTMKISNMYLHLKSPLYLFSIYIIIKFIKKIKGDFLVSFDFLNFYLSSSSLLSIFFITATTADLKNKPHNAPNKKKKKKKKTKKKTKKKK